VLVEIETSVSVWLKNDWIDITILNFFTSTKYTTNSLYLYDYYGETIQTNQNNTMTMHVFFCGPFDHKKRIML